MHTLLIGQTECGKTCLAKILATQLRKRKNKVVVLDPMVDPGWECDELFEKPEELGEYLRSPENRSTYVFIDECGTIFNEGRDLTHSWLVTKSRHFGHSVNLISQRAVQVPSTMRYQCNRLYVFNSSRKDGMIHAEEWNKDILVTINQLPQYHFYCVDRFQLCKRYKIVNWKDIREVKDSPKAMPLPDDLIDPPPEPSNIGQNSPVSVDTPDEPSTVDA